MNQKGRGCSWRTNTRLAYGGSVVQCRNLTARKGPRTVQPDKGKEIPDRESPTELIELCGEYIMYMASSLHTTRYLVFLLA